jgi:hypothetical protein
MIASTPNCNRLCTARTAVAELSPSSRVINRIWRPFTPPLWLISLTPNCSASAIDTPISDAVPTVGKTAPMTSVPSFR